MRSKYRAPIALLVFAALVGGCVIQQVPSEGEPEPNAPAQTTPQVSIILSNWTNLDVQPNFYRSATADTEETLFTGQNLVTDFTDRAFPELRPGEAVVLTFDCDLVASIGVQDPVFFDSTNLIVHNSEDGAFLLQDTDFSCENTIKFVFFRQNGVYQVRAERP